MGWAGPAALAVGIGALLVGVGAVAPGDARWTPSASSPATVPHTDAVHASVRPLAPRPFDPRHASTTPFAGGQSRLLVNTTDAAAVPNDGIRSNFTDYYAIGLNPESSFQVAGSEVIGAYEAVFGFFQNALTYPIPFFTVFSNATDATLRLVYWSNLTLTGGESYEFELVRSTGTNWTLRVNGAEFGGNASDSTFDFGAAEATWAGGISFSEVGIYAGDPPTPNSLAVPLAFAVAEPAGWYLPVEGRAYAYGTAAGGAQGRLQNATFAPGEILTGSTVPGAPNGTVLWTGGPVAISVSIAAAVSPVPGTAVDPVTITTRTASGGILPGVSVYLHDADGAAFVPPLVVTMSGGTASAGLSAPNVSAPSMDLVTASSAVFGYLGLGTTTVTIDPAVQIRFSSDPSSVTGTTGRSLVVTLAATNGSAAPAVGILVDFAVSGGDANYLPYGTTDAAGLLPVVLTLPSVAGTITLVASVATPGYWGHFALRIPVHVPPPTLLERATPFLLVAAAAAAVACVVLAVRWVVRRRGPVPKLVLPPPPADVEPADPTRTRP